MGAIRRKGTITIIYEGAQIVIIDPADEDQGEAHPVPVATANPVMRKLIEKIWSRINPADLVSGISIQDRVKDSIVKTPGKIRNIEELPSWSRNAALAMVEKGIMDVGSDGTFKSGVNMKFLPGESGVYPWTSTSLPPR